MVELLLFIIPIAAVTGWLVGYRHHKRAEVFEEQSLIPHDYYVGLNYLINEQPDKAVDVFIKMLEVNTDTVETHLALGNLFRRRGEVDRAIRVHQNLIARPQLAKHQRVQALFELAQDYLRAGFFDRAERIFSDLIELGDEVTSSLSYLQHIYQQQKDWQQAIITAKKLDAAGGANMDAVIAHYYCELAEQARSQNNIEQAHEHIKEALGYDKRCVRANILLGKLFESSGQYKQALNAFKHVQEYGPEFVSEIINHLATCYSKLNLEDDFERYLKKAVADNPRIYFILALTDYVRKKQGDAAAIDYISEQLPRCLSLRGLARLVDLYLSNVDAKTREKLFVLKDFITKLFEHKPIYRCVHCGFSGKQIYWQCPSCRRWDAVKPIHGLEGD